jgi:hypothetical protein
VNTLNKYTMITCGVMVLMLFLFLVTHQPVFFVLQMILCAAVITMSITNIIQLYRAPDYRAEEHLAALVELDGKEKVIEWINKTFSGSTRRRFLKIINKIE